MDTSSPISPVEDFYVGGAAAARSPALLKAFKIGFIINAAPEEPNLFPDQFKYIRVTLPDGAHVCRQLVDAMTQMEAFIEIARAADSRVLVHCSMGQVRAPTLAGLLLVKRGMEPGAAATYVTRRRPVADPDTTILKVLHKHLLRKRKSEERKEDERSDAAASASEAEELKEAQEEEEIGTRHKRRNSNNYTEKQPPPIDDV